MATIGRGFSYPRRFNKLEGFDEFRIAESMNWEYLESYLNNNVVFLTDGVYTFNDDILIEYDGRLLLDGPNLRAQIYMDGGDDWRLDVDGNVRAQAQGNADWTLYDSAGVARFQINETSDEVEMSDGTNGLLPMFPKPYIASASLSSSTDITNVSASGEELTAITQTIACEYANQPVMVQFIYTLMWDNLDVGVSYRSNGFINGSELASSKRQIDSFHDSAAVVAISEIPATV
jgi:hypothetical protein